MDKVKNVLLIECYYYNEKEIQSFMKTIQMGHKIIGKGQPPFIIAEAGINHNGELAKAFEMIKVAKSVGADAMKFQTFKAEEFVSDQTLTYTYQSQGKEVTESMLEMFKRYEFSKDEWSLIKQRCDEEGILFLSTPQNYSDLELLMKIGIPAVKIGSDDFSNLPLLKSYAQTNLPLLLSCGMADLGEVYKALEIVGALDGYPVVLLLCTSQYPTPAEDVNLHKLQTLANAFPMVTLGFSDHTQGSLAASIAVGLGAVVFEKHFTLNNDLPGPDHWFSEDPHSLQKWITDVRTAYAMLGSACVRPTTKEREMRVLARRSVIALKDIKIGEEFTVHNMGLRRPGTGLSPGMFETIVGKQATGDIKGGQLLKWGDFKE